MSDRHSSGPPLTSPPRTWTTLSSSRPDSYSSDDASSDGYMRRITISPAPTDYDQDDNSFTDSAEVEAVLAAVDDEFSTTEVALTEWGSRTLDPHNFHPRSLSTITERTDEDAVSRRLSAAVSAFGQQRPYTPLSAANPSSEAFHLDHHTPDPATPRSLTPSRSRASDTDKNASPERTLRHTPSRRAGDLIAFFEDKSSDSSSLSSFGNVRSASSPRSPTYTASQSLPSLARFASDAPPPSYSSIPRSTTLPALDSRSISPTKSSAALSSLLSPPRGGSSLDVRPAPSTAASSGKQLPQEPGSPRSPLVSVRNIVAAWRERTPSQSKVTKTSSTGSGVGEEGFFSIRRRGADDATRSLPPLPTHSLSHQSINGSGRKSGASVASGKSPFDIAELGSLAPSDREPLRLGQLWYLNVHAAPPYRWLRTQAVLYAHVLILSWIAPGGGRGVITLDLLNCNEVRSVPSPSHPSAHDDIGTNAAREQAGASGTEGELLETLCPFQLLYPDGVERLGAESARERVRWVGAIWEALNRAVSFPDPSTRSRSPAPSIRTIRSMDSSGSSGSAENKSKSGSASTVFIPPLDTIPDLPSASESVSSHASSLESHGHHSHASFDRAGLRHLRVSDDGAISNAGIVYSLERSGSKIIAPSRGSSLRRTTSLADLDAEFVTAKSWSTSSSSSSNKPATALNGSSSVEDDFVSSPSLKIKSRKSSKPKSKSDSGDSGYLTPPSRLNSTLKPKSDSGESGYLSPPSRISARTMKTSSYYSLSSTQHADSAPGPGHSPRRPRPNTEISAPQSIVSLHDGPSSALLGESHDGYISDANSASSHTLSSFSDTLSSSKWTLHSQDSSSASGKNGSTLSRSVGVKRRTPRKSSSRKTSMSSAATDYNTPIEGSDKENDTNAESPKVATPTEKSYRSVGAMSPSTPTRSSAYISAHTTYVTARTQTPTSTAFTTPSLAPSSTEYASATCPCPPSTEYLTADVCTEYESAATCRSEPSTQYETAQVCPPSEAPSSRPPSSMETIPSLSGSTVSIVPFMTSPSPAPPRVVSSATSSRTTSSSSMPPATLVDLRAPTQPSPVSSSIISASSTTLSSVTPSTIPRSSSATPTASSMLAPPRSSSVPSIRESLYEESSGTYESSVLLPSPSLHSVPLHEGVDTSFDTSFLRPSDSVEPPEVVVQAVPASPPLLSPSSSIVSRTPSTVSSISMSSSRVSPDAESLYGYFPPSSFPSSSSISSESSVTPESLSSTTSRTPVPPPSSTRTSTPLSPSIPSTPIPPAITVTPEPTFSVSISTPSSNVPSIVSQLDTLSSSVSGIGGLEGPPGAILTHDVNRLLQYLREVDDTRNDQSQSMVRHLDRIEAELRELSVLLKEKAERPPPVPTKDASAGRSTITRTPTPVPPNVPSVTSLTPPPLWLPSPPSLPTSVSWLSSHHSDDWELMSAEEWPPFVGPLPPTTTSTSSPPPSSRLSRAPSAATVRPPETSSLNQLQDMLGKILQEVAVLRDGQQDAHEKLNELLQETTEREDHSEASEQRRCKAMIKKIEEMLERVLERLASDSSSSATASSVQREQDRLREALLKHREPKILRDLPTLHMPIPRPPSRSAAERFPDIPGVEPVSPIQLDPLPTIQRPRIRLRPRSTTPPVILVRSRTAPVPSSDGEYRDIPPFRPADTTTSEAFSPTTRPRQMQFDDLARQPLSRTPAGARDAPSPDMYRLLRRIRASRRADAPDGIFRPAPPPLASRASGPPRHEVPARQPSAPPSFGGWYRPRADTVAMGDAPPAPSAQRPSVGGTFVPIGGPPHQLPGATTIQRGPVPVQQSQQILDLLHETREAQNATINEQREIMRYMASLNEWLERDVHDRQSELRGIGDRVDQLRNDLAQRLGIRPAAPIGQPLGDIIFPPQPQWHGPGVVGAPPVFPGAGVMPHPGIFRPESEEGIPYIPPSPGMQTGLPAGFVPYPPGVVAVGPPVQGGPVVGYPAGTPRVTVVSPSPAGSTQEDGFIPPRPSRPSSPSRGATPVTVIQPRPSPDPNAPSVNVIQPTIEGSGVGLSRPQGGIVIVPPPVEHPRSRSRTPGGRPFIERERGRSLTPRGSSRGRHEPHTIIVRRSRSRSRSAGRSPPRTQVILERRPSRSRHRSRSPAAGPPIVIGGRRSRSRSSTPPRQTVIVPDRRSRSRSRDRHRAPAGPIVIDGGRRSRSRSPRVTPPQQILMRRSRSRSRHRSPGQQPIIISGGGRRSRTRSRSPTRAPVIIDDTHRRSSRRRSPTGPIILGDRRRSRSYSRSPERVVMVPEGRRSRSRTPFPRQVTVMGPSRSRSPRHRNGGTVFIDDGGRRSRSRGRSPAIIVPDRHRSRSHNGRTQVVIDDGGRRSRSRSRGRNSAIIVPSRHRSRSHNGRTQVVIPRSRSRSHSPRTVFLDEHDRHRRRSSSPRTLFVDEPDGHHRSHSRPPTHISHRTRSRSPRGTEYLVPRSPPRSHGRTEVIVPRSRSRSPRPSEVFIPHSRTHSPERPVVIEARPRSRERGRSVVLGDPGERAHTRPPTEIILPSRHGSTPGDRTRSPSRLRRSDSPEDEEFDDGRATPRGSAYLSREQSPPPPTVIQVPSGRSRSRGRRERSPTIVRARRRPRSPSPEYRLEGDAGTRHPSIHTASPEFEGAPSIAPSRAEHDAGWPVRRTPPEFDQGAPSRPTSRLEHDAGGPARRTPEFDQGAPPRTPSRMEHDAGGPARRTPEFDQGAPPRTPSRMERDVGGPARHPSVRPVSAESVPDSQVIPAHRTPSEVAFPGQDRYDEAFNDAEDERRLRHQDAERGRDEAAAQAEHRRDDEFREHEDERQRIFEEGEMRRNQTAEEMRQDIFAAAEDQRGAVADEGASVRAASIRTAMDEVASKREDSLRSVVSEEREELRRAREAAEAERAGLLATMEADRARLQEEHDAKVRALEEELVTLRETAEAQRIENERNESERTERQQMDMLERDSGLRDQLAEITNLLNEKAEECERFKALCEERWNAKEERRTKKDDDWEALKNLVQRIADENEASRALAAEEKEREAEKPGIDAILEALQKQNAEQSALLTSLADGWRTDSERQHAEILETVKRTANEQVPYNIQGYLDQFSRALADEVRMLLGEVGKLREEKRNLQFEMGYLMCMRSKYGPGGEFDPDWKPNIPPFAGDGGPPGGPPPPGGPFPPEEPHVSAKPAWRNVTAPAPPKLSKRQKRQQQREAEEAAAASLPLDDTRASWITWQPNPHYAPTPPTQEAELVTPMPERPGLFGPRSPLNK